MADRNFLGKGMKFPPQIDKSTGRFKVASELESVKESVYIILMTRVNERWLRPEFGSNLLSYTFADITPTTLTIMKRDISEAILTHEPRVEDVDVSISDESTDGKMIINIEYTVVGKYTRDSLVFPFYVNASKEA